MIREIRRYVSERGTVTREDICIRFRMDESAVEPVLEILERQGYIKVDRGTACSSCLKSCPFAGKPAVFVSVSGSEGAPCNGTN